MNKIIAVIALVAIVGFGIFSFFNKEDKAVTTDQQVLSMVLNLSREYTALRYETDNVLLNAQNFSSYGEWSKKTNSIIARWQSLEIASQELFLLSEIILDESVGFHITPVAYAYDREEISNIFDRAPAGKKIATLAKHLGVDAKMAYGILKQDQAQVEADAWNEAGNTFQTLETSATLIKDGCKITTFVGTIALTGGTAAIAAGSTLGKAAVIVAGADLTLEVTDDAAKIALGNNNKISTIIGDARIVTEPVAAILMISTLPSNLTGAIDKLGAVTFGAEQLNSTIQEGKVIGIKLPTPKKGTTGQKMEVSVLKPSETSEWILNETSSKDEDLTQQDIEDLLNLDGETTSGASVSNNEVDIPSDIEQNNVKAIDEAGSTDNEYIVGTWKGILSFTQSAEAEESAMDFVLEIQPDGKLGGEAAETYSSWILVNGNLLRLMSPDDEVEGYDEFLLKGNSLTFTKRAGINSDGVWQEDFAASEFFGGRFIEIYLEKI